MPMDFVICSFQEVYDINTQHAIAWRATMAKLSRSQKDALIESQKQWLAHMFEQCGLPAKGKPNQADIRNAAQCVRQSYIDRIKFIRDYAHA